MKKFSSHLLKVYSALKESDGTWLSINEIAGKSGINPITTKHHVRFLFKEKVLERAETYPYVYKMSTSNTFGFGQEIEQTINKLNQLS